MGEELRVPLTVMVSITPLPQAEGCKLQVERVTIAPSFITDDPLHWHIALMLQVALEGDSVARQLSGQSLADAFRVPVLSRDDVPQQSSSEVTGALSPYKLRRTITYITDHLERDLSLSTLAAVVETSPAHFARLFKHATGLTPHQYVTGRRIDEAKRLLAETDETLINIGLQVGCADQSHFTALFHKHTGMTPKAYRNSIKN